MSARVHTHIGFVVHCKLNGSFALPPLPLPSTHTHIMKSQANKLKRERFALPCYVIVVGNQRGLGGELHYWADRRQAGDLVLFNEAEAEYCLAHVVVKTVGFIPVV